MGLNKIQISLPENGKGEVPKIIVNGHDLAESIYGFVIRADAESGAWLSVDFRPGTLEFEGNVDFLENMLGAKAHQIIMSADPEEIHKYVMANVGRGQGKGSMVQGVLDYLREELERGD